ncbi:MAG: molecular chaperone HtpG [Chlamydiae bacterium]|nr:molecular chaperone HtpG [Chlamydiota bacterium]
MQKSLSINSENILPIIKKWLYSEKEIFLRELISNSTDAINKLKIIQNPLEDFRIDINIDKSKKTLSISDNGIGMTSSEVDKYISQIAFSGAKDFLDKFQDKEDKIIGHFGLGFYSAFMVSKKVEIETLSYQQEKPVFWSCDGSSSYDISEGTRDKRGTTVTLFLDDDNEEFLSEEKIKSILNRFCLFLPFPIFLNNKNINNQDPLWLKPTSSCQDKDYLEFYQKLYPFEEDPTLWIHLNVDFPFNLKGILYFPKIKPNFDLNQSTIRLFCNRVFVSDNCKDILPDYLTVLKGAIDSSDIPLNVSRSYLQVDSKVRQLGSHIAKKICDKLSLLYTQEKEKFISSWTDLEWFIKLGILQDDKFFDRSKNFLIWKNQKNEWTTLEDYLERSSDKKIYYIPEGKAHSSFLKLYQDKNIEVLFTNNTIDTHLLSFLEQKTSFKFQRIDSGLDSIIDPTKEKDLLDKDGRSESFKIAESFKTALGIEVEAKSLSNETTPAFILFNEEEKRFSDYLAMTGQKSIPKHTLVVNTNNPLVLKIHALMQKHPDLSKELTKQVYDLALLSQKELPAQELDNFVTRSSLLFEKMAQLL